MSIWLPRMMIERWWRIAGNKASPDARIALVVEAQHGPVIAAATEAAAQAGARVAMRLTDARALDPELIAVPADPAGDAALLARLARWASRWSPLVEVDGEDGLRLDVTGVAHLFGDEAGLVADIEARFGAIGLSVRVAVAATAGAAWGLARYSPSPYPLPQGERELSTALASLPVAALRLPAAVTRTLERLGLKTIGALAGVPRRSLARRFREADNPLDALDRMLGRMPEPLIAVPYAPPPRALLRLAEPVTEPSAGARALGLLVPGLVRQLAARRLGARRLVLAGYRVDGEVLVVSAATALATRDAKHLIRLMADKAGELDPGYGFDAFALEASWCEPLGAAQDSLVDEPKGEREVARLVDRLSVKLGAGKVRRPQARASHVPERASGWRSAVAECQYPSTIASSGMNEHAMPPAWLKTDGGSLHSFIPPPREISGRNEALRPQRMLDMPEAIGVLYATPQGLPRRFVWRRVVHDVVRVEGPERIAPEWWRERASTRLRDYYRVEDREGRRYWIYREGLFGDGRGGEPIWYLHGLFG